MSTEITTSEVLPILKDVFGFNQFRGLQAPIIDNVMAGKNTFVIMPTGAGKSLCYQLPALAQPGTAIVISPLIALMKNQVDQLSGIGVNAQFLNSTLTKSEMQRVKREVLDGTVKLLYVAPESLNKDENVAFLKNANISFVAIDEAHCISEWGHDFRPEYRRIKSIIESIGNLPIVALTATATPKVQLDIQKNLQMEEASIFKSSFNRPNLFYEVRPKIDTKKQLIKFIKQRKGEAGIIYCLSRKKVEEIADFLCVNDIKALPYHAGLDSHTRMRNQDGFLKDDADVIVATIAFGMGIDKPNVRYVIHYDAPKSLEGYYQETGRAGRDGVESTCLMFYTYDDIIKLDKFNKDKTVTERDNARLLLEEMADYADTSLCRRRQLLHYFGEINLIDCGFCDNCTKPSTKQIVESEVVACIQAVALTDQRFGLRHLADLLAGVENDYVVSYSHNQLPVFGIGKDKTPQYWYSMIRQVMLANFLEKDIENYGVVKVTPEGEAYVKAPYKFTYSVDHDYTQAEEDDKDNDDASANAMGNARSYDENLFAQLKMLCKKIGDKNGVPPYTVFLDPSLQEMATVYPTTIEDLAQINGVGSGKIAKFGKPALELISKYVEENEIETASDVLVKVAVNRSNIKIHIIQQVDRRVSLEDIAKQKAVPLATVIEELEHICYSGTKLNLNYYVNDILSPEAQDEIYDYFMASETDSMTVANEYFNGDYSEEEIRVMRIKFISDIAN